MKEALLASLVAVLAALLLVGCASGRVRGAQGTEMGQAREYEPESKVDPPEGNVMRTSGPLTQPVPPPVLEVDLERRRQPPSEPEPSPTTPPETEVR